MGNDICGCNSHPLPLAPLTPSPCHTYDGSPGRILRLYLSISSDIVPGLIEGRDRLNYSDGLWGHGLYFTENCAEIGANTAVVDAFVSVGQSLVCKMPVPNMTYRTLTQGYGCESVLGVLPIQRHAEYVVYSRSQVWVREIRVGSEVQFWTGVQPGDMETAKSHMKPLTRIANLA